MGATNDNQSKPLSGVVVLVTRPEHQADGLRKPLLELGAEVLVQAAIEIAPPHDWSKVDDALARLEWFDWLVFSSSNGVSFLLERIRLLDGCAGDEHMDRLTAVNIAAIGPGTAAQLKKNNLLADLVPDEHRAESLAEELLKRISAAPGGATCFLLVRADRGRPILRERLAAAGGIVEEITVYESRDVPPDRPEVGQITAAMAAGRINWVTVTSSAIARSLVRMFGEKLRRVKLVSISPITSGVLAELGFPPAAEAIRYTMDGVVAAIVAAEKKN